MRTMMRDGTVEGKRRQNEAACYEQSLLMVFIFCAEISGD